MKLRSRDFGDSLALARLAPPVASLNEAPKPRLRRYVEPVFDQRALDPPSMKLRSRDFGD